ncbi:NAD-dependent epimerase/dehydratase family protein [Paenibacillus albus]|uniref:NAD(P)-dependent oxidoreductase n=1 Tax=Paenibacillus albus TaxID=2495582 RepID=A0A3S9A2J6_9BACL|nr:NAD(P)-dependent oxidoreductase [Paenibacillus albus]AZN39949.1 NAD(P)-dependent oxidoreductase [Paenibacillus albus]
MKVLVTGASGNGGQAVCQRLLQAGHQVRMADVMPSKVNGKAAEFVRCDTRTVSDVQQAVRGMDGVIHLAAWHCAHQPPVSDDTIFAVNVDGTYNVLEACRKEGVRSIVYASSMAYGWWSVYGVSKVIGEDLCRAYHEMTGASIAMLRYHEFIPRPYLEFGARLLRNGVDRRDVASATVMALEAAAAKAFGLFRTIIHTNHEMPEHVRADFTQLGLEWCEQQVPGSSQLIEKYGIELPKDIEQHDLSEANRVLGWKPQIGFTDFLRDLKLRNEQGLEIHDLVVPSELPNGLT